MTAALLLTPLIWQRLRTTATRALPRETGGLLLGHYTDRGPRVTAAPAVPDPRATRIRYRRDSESAARILGDHIQADEADLLGYLGEWHTHPLPAGPSPADVRAVARLAGHGGHEVALLVLSFGPRGWVGHARKTTPTGTVHDVDLYVEGHDDD